MIKQTLFTGWNTMRWIRLALGIFIAIQAIQMHDTIRESLLHSFYFRQLQTPAVVEQMAVQFQQAKANQTR